MSTKYIQIRNIEEISRELSEQLQKNKQPLCLIIKISLTDFLSGDSVSCLLLCS